MNNTNGWMIVVGLIGVMALHVEGAPTKAPASPAAPAIAALLAEYQAAMKDNKEDSLRSKSDYFTKEKNTAITPEIILTELEKTVSTDPRADVYVKWQLLSGIDGKFPDTVAARAIRAYRNAPLPPDHPGIKHDALQKALNRMGATKANLETPINKELTDAIDKYKVTVKPFVAYREEFYTKLQPSYDMFEAAFFDMYTRASHGADAYDMWKTMDKDIRAWALKSNESQHMAALSADLNKLYKLVNDEKNKPYYRVMWMKDRYAEGLKWQSEGVAGNTKSMGEIADWLGEHAKSTAAIAQESPAKK
jgi:hypothetical protein